MPNADIIGIPHGTRLHAIVMCGGETHVWIACKQRGPDYAKWQGTYLRIKSNGEITRITNDGNYVDDASFVVRPASPT